MKKDIFDNLQLPSDIDIRKETASRKTAQKLSGRKRPEHSEQMKQDNPMKGKVSPNRGKVMPQISEKVKGKKKPIGFGEKISQRRKELGLGNTMGGKKRPEHSERMKENNPGLDKTRVSWTCEYCGKEGVGSSNYVRWHGDNCKQNLFTDLILPTDEEIKQETKKKIVSNKLKGKKRPIEHCNAISNGLKGQSITNNKKQAISKGLIGITKGIKKRTMICPHCNLEGGISSMTRFHFDNCSSKNIIIGTNIKTGKKIQLSGNAQIKNAGFSYGNIIGCINGERKSHKGFTWRKK